MIPISRLFAVAAVALFCGGCYFENPLTERPSKDINTWLLGVWEHKSSDGRVSSVTVAPMTGDHYSVKAIIAGPTPRSSKRYEFEGWSSRVGDTNFLTLRCLQSQGDMPTGNYVFLQTQLLDQNDVRVHGLRLDVPAATTSFELRKEVRKRLKNRSLYDPEKTMNWKRVAEVVWTRDGETPTFTPLRNSGEIPTIKEQIKKLRDGTL